MTLLEQSKVDMIRTDDSRDVNYNGDTDSDTDSEEVIQNIRNKKINSSQRLSGNESDESDFHPKLFGLLDNPGVMRFDHLDYPLAVTEDSDEDIQNIRNKKINPSQCLSGNESDESDFHPKIVWSA